MEQFLFFLSLRQTLTDQADFLDTKDSSELLTDS